MHWRISIINIITKLYGKTHCPWLFDETANLALLKTVHEWLVFMLINLLISHWKKAPSRFRKKIFHTKPFFGFIFFNRWRDSVENGSYYGQIHRFDIFYISTSRKRITCKVTCFKPLIHVLCKMLFTPDFK